MVFTALILAATVAATPTPVPDKTTTLAPAPARASQATGARTLADVARERKLGVKGVQGGTLSVAGASTSDRDVAAKLDNVKVQISDTKAAIEAVERMTRALDNASWVNQNIHYNWSIIQAAQSEWDAAAENCRKTPGCTPVYRK